MQKILSFELATAMRGRPKTFQAITLLLLSFSIAVVVFSFLRFLDSEKADEAFRQADAVNLAETAPASSLLGLKK